LLKVKMEGYSFTWFYPSATKMKELDKSITTDEICVVVWDCGENKSTGPDGYTFEFFRRFWNLIGPDVCSAVLCFFNHVVTKILANRLAMVIFDLVSNTQSAFVMCRQILDGSFILNKDKVLAYKKKGGLGVSSFFALNRALHLKWGSILRESQALALKGFDFLSYCKLQVDSVKEVSVAVKFGDPSLDDSFRRQVKDGSERQQWLDLVLMFEFNGDRAFRVKEVRSNLDVLFLPYSDVVTRWVRLSIIDKGEGNDDIINKRMAVIKSIRELDKLQSMEAAQKAKIK
nr:RNA-directed DNA polymerase, eukaryota [Tanacetum cinerariifolium]